MTLGSYLVLLAVWFAAIASPGPDLFQMIRVGSTGKRAGIACALGVMTGNAIWSSLSPAGLSALMQSRPSILAILQLVGGGYLIYMGLGAARSGLKIRGTTATMAYGTGRFSDWAAWRAGLSANLSNPKAMLFFGAIFAQFIQPDMSLATSAAVWLLMMITGAAWFGGVGIAAHKAAEQVGEKASLIDLITGIIFVGIGIWMFVEGIMTLR